MASVVICFQERTLQDELYARDVQTMVGKRMKAVILPREGSSLLVMCLQLLMRLRLVLRRCYLTSMHQAFLTGLSCCAGSILWFDQKQRRSCSSRSDCCLTPAC